MRTLTISVIWIFMSTVALAGMLPDSIGYYLRGKDTVVIYQVTAGETLSGIARKYNIDISGITALNPGLVPAQLKEGQIIKIPGAWLRQQYRPDGNISVTSTPQKTSLPTARKHTIMRGETLYAIARHYEVPVEALIEANPGLQPDKIYPGQVISIPGVRNTPSQNDKPGNPATEISSGTIDKQQTENPNPNTSTTNQEGQQPAHPPVKEGEELLHTVVKGETMYSISRKYDVKVTDLMAWNNLPSYQIDIGDQLIIKLPQKTENPSAATSTNSPNPAPEIADKEPAVSPSPKFTYDGVDNILSLQYKEQLSSTYYIEERANGIATWIDDAKGYPYENGYFALHRTLPIGTIIKVRNLMNDKIIFAKIIGRLPSTDANEKIMLKLPQEAKKALKVLDAQLVMEVSYLRKIQ